MRTCGEGAHRQLVTRWVGSVVAPQPLSGLRPPFLRPSLGWGGPILEAGCLLLLLFRLRLTQTIVRRQYERSRGVLTSSLCGVHPNVTEEQAEAERRLSEPGSAMTPYAGERGAEVSNRGPAACC